MNLMNLFLFLNLSKEIIFNDFGLHINKKLTNSLPINPVPPVIKIFLS